jgi:hypothetical protein
VAGYPSKEHDARSTAAALYQYFSTYGLIDEIISDPGSEFINEVVEHLTSWFGVNHVFSLVDRHESNGVEPTNREILRHLKALVMDERIKDKWSDTTVLPGVFWIINSQVSTESGIVPFHAHFGNQNATYFRVPDGVDQKERTSEYVKLLSANLELISAISRRFQENIVQERTKSSRPEKQNQFQPGDFVLLQMNPNEFLPSKLYPRFKGPYEVVQQYKNDVECRSLIYGSISKFHVSRLKLFHGECSEAELRDRAFKMAQIDNDQYVVLTIHAYTGDVERRSTMHFEVEFVDASRVWLPFSKDLFQTEQFEEFVNRNPELLLLKHTVEVARVISREINSAPITAVNVGDTVFVDLRQYGCEWYESLELEAYQYRKYVLQFEYGEWKGSNRRKIEVSCDLMMDEYVVNHLWVQQFGSIKKFDEANMVLVGAQFILDHPDITSSNRREQVLQHCRDVLGL